MSFSTLRKGVLGVALLIGLLLVCALFAEVLFTDGHVDARESRAHLVCQSLSQAAEEYRNNPANAKHEYPRELSEFLQPPWGGPPILKCNPSDLQDPWGKPYQLEHRRTADGRDYPFVWTTAPNGTPISAFGIGSKLAFPTF
jgi:hypothetical protein